MEEYSCLFLAAISWDFQSIHYYLVYDAYKMWIENTVFETWHSVFSVLRLFSLYHFSFPELSYDWHCFDLLIFLFTLFQEPWLMALLGFHVVLLLVTIISRKKTNFQMFLFLLTCMWHSIFILLNEFFNRLYRLI